jgi:hypothetical protein
MEVTVLSPSFDWKLKSVHFYSKKYEIKVESDKEHHPL